jgi:hypothetical protein
MDALLFSTVIVIVFCISSIFVNYNEHKKFFWLLYEKSYHAVIFLPANVILNKSLSSYVSMLR